MSDCLLCPNSLQQHERQCCTACVAHVRAELEELEERYALLAVEAEHHPADAIPGGPAMVAMAAGSSGVMQVRAWASGQDDGYLADEWAKDGASISFELARWEDEIRRLRRDPAAVVAPARFARDHDTELRTLHSAVTYLTRNLDWAAAWCDVFDDLAKDVRRLLGAVRGITRSGPQYDVPCTKCSVPLLLVDVTERDGSRVGMYRCPRCHRRYDDAAYWVAVHQHFVEAVEQEAASG